jgi:hypothetical protein
MSTGMDDLPEEMLAHVVRRLPPRSLAVCRSVCKSWRAVVDTRRLLHAVAHLVPRSLRGIFVNHIGKETHSFFSRGASPVDHALSFLPRRRMCHTSRVLDHRNGLLIYQNGTNLFLCNPATRRCAALPPPPTPTDQRFYRHRLYLMFDPTVSLHYDVLYFPEVPEKPKPYPERRNGRSAILIRYSYDNLPPPVREAYERDVNRVGSMEWPPLSYGVQVYSSRTGHWEETRFIRQGDSSAALTVSDVWSDPPAPSSNYDMLRCHAVCWRGAFYVHCRGGFVMR